MSKIIEKTWENKCMCYNRYRKALRDYGPLLGITAKRWKIYKKARKQWLDSCKEH